MFRYSKAVGSAAGGGAGQGVDRARVHSRRIPQGSDLLARHKIPHRSNSISFGNSFAFLRLNCVTMAFFQTGQKSAILRFLRDLTQYLDSATIQNSSETRLVISKLVGWCNEPKNAEVRREAAKSIRSLFALNPAQVTFHIYE